MADRARPALTSSLRRFARPLLLALGLLVAQRTATAAQPPAGRIVSPQGTFSSLAEALAAAEEGDTLDVYGGVYLGPIVIERSVQLIGHDGPVIDGRGRGSVVTLAAPNITLRHFVVRDSGDSLDQENSGIVVEAPGAIIEDNRLEETLFGIYLREASGSTIRHNTISSKDLALARRGDPIRIWYSNDVLIEGNEVRRGRDVVLWYSEDLTIRGNQISAGRYGLHFMYCDDATIEQNQLTGNSVGAFLMYSRRLRLIDNVVAANRGPSGYGVGLKDVDDAVVRDNLFLDNRVGAYLDNSPREVDSVGRITGNFFAYNDIGISLMPSVRHNEFSRNSFVDNEEQVSIAGGGTLRGNVWTVGEDGNYWSDYAGFDADGDGRGDLPYKAERLFENLTDSEPTLRLFLYSPVEQAVDFAARAAPFVRPQPKLTDDAPLMAPIMPAGLPEMAEVESQALWLASLALVGLGALLLGLGSFRVGEISVGRRSRPPVWPAGTAALNPNESD